MWALGMGRGCPVGGLGVGLGLGWAGVCGTRGWWWGLRCALSGEVLALEGIGLPGGVCLPTGRRVGDLGYSGLWL